MIRLYYKVLGFVVLIYVMSHTLLAQTDAVPDFINYQAAAYDADGEVMAEQLVDVRLSILKGESTLEPVYTETHDVTTDKRGMFSLKINNGESTDDFSMIDWATDKFYLKVELNTGDGFRNMGMQQFVSVPYALAAKNVADVSMYELEDVDTATLSQNNILKWDGKVWKPGTDNDKDVDFSLPVSKVFNHSNPFVIENTTAGSFTSGIKGISVEGDGIKGISNAGTGVSGSGDIGGFFNGDSQGVRAEIFGITSGGKKALLTESILGYRVVGSSCKGCATPITNYGIWASAVGGTTNYAGWFDGDVHIAGTLTNPSDRRLKASIADLPENTLYNVMQLSPKSFMYRDGDYGNSGLPSGEQFGFVAQEVEKVFPQLINEEISPESSAEDGTLTFKSMNYIQLVPVLTKALQEQQQTIDELEERITKLEKMVNSLK